MTTDYFSFICHLSKISTQEDHKPFATSYPRNMGRVIFSYCASIIHLDGINNEMKWDLSLYLGYLFTLSC